MFKYIQLADSSHVFLHRLLTKMIQLTQREGPAFTEKFGHHDVGPFQRELEAVSVKVVNPIVDVNERTDFVPERDTVGYHVDSKLRTVWHMNGGRINLTHSLPDWMLIVLQNEDTKLGTDLRHQLLHNPRARIVGYHMLNDGQTVWHFMSPIDNEQLDEPIPEEAIDYTLIDDSSGI